MNPAKTIYISSKLCGKCEYYKLHKCVKTDGGSFSCKVRNCPTFRPSVKYYKKKYGVEMVSIAK